MLAFDLETYQDDQVLPWLPPCEAPGNYKDPDKIAAAIAEKTRERNSKLALDPDCCRIVALGYATTGSGGVPTVNICQDEADETIALENFWAEWERVGAAPVGFNCVGFDLPVLVQRSRLLSVSYPRINLRRYGSPDCYDLMLILNHDGITSAKSLGFWCKRFRLDVPEDTTSGKDIAGMVEAQDWAAVERHCAIDVAKTWALARRVLPGVE
jgi:hypothetical protein